MSNRWAAGFVAGALLLTGAACSGSDGGDEAATTTTDAPISPQVYEAAATALCQQLVEAGGPADGKAMDDFEEKLKRIKPPPSMAEAMKTQVWPAFEKVREASDDERDDAAAGFRQVIGGLGFDGCVQALG